MSALSRWWFGKTGTEMHDAGGYETKSIGNLIVPEKLTNKNAFTLANSVAEINFPVDFYADRISKLRFYIATKSGRELPNTELNRFVNDSINPLFSFSDLIYQYVFSLLADGNSINYLTVPSIYKTITPSTVQRWDVLQPDLVELDEHNNVSMLNVSSWNELIRRVYYNDGVSTRSNLEVDRLAIHNYGLKRRDYSSVLAQSPLFSANKSIDTLLSVYSARYNVYANNGAAGYLSRKTTSSNNSLETALTNMDGSKRDDIIADINARNGLTGRRNIWGISGVPIEFVKTLATIKELMPLEETLENAIKIAGILNIPSDLVPRKDHSTYDNQIGQERSVWENGLLSVAKTTSINLTKMFGLDKTGNQIMFDTSNVSALVENAKQLEELTALKLENIQKVKEINPDLDIDEIITEIHSRYGTEK